MSKKKMYVGTVQLWNGKRKYIRSVDKEEFDKKMAEARLAAGSGVDLTDNSTFGQFAQLWFDTYKKPNLRQNSREDVQYILNNHIMPDLASKPLRSIKPMDIRRLMASKAEYSQPIQKKILMFLRSIFDAAQENHLIAENPVPKKLKPGGTPTAEKKPLTVEQSKRLLDTLRGTRAFTPVALMLGAGLRREEVCGLMWEDVDLENSSITVNHALPFDKSGHGTVSNLLKSDAAHRIIPIPAWLRGALKTEAMSSASRFVVPMTNGEPMTLASFKSVWSLIERRTTDNPELLGQPVGVTHPEVTYALDFHVHPHLLRHTCATQWIANGLTVKEVQYLLGHATPEMTLRIYAHYLEDEERSVTAKKIQNCAIYAQTPA